MTEVLRTCLLHIPPITSWRHGHHILQVSYQTLSDFTSSHAVLGGFCCMENSIITICTRYNAQHETRFILFPTLLLGCLFIFSSYDFLKLMHSSTLLTSSSSTVPCILEVDRYANFVCILQWSYIKYFSTDSVCNRSRTLEMASTYRIEMHTYLIGNVTKEAPPLHFYCFNSSFIFLVGTSLQITYFEVKKSTYDSYLNIMFIFVAGALIYNPSTRLSNDATNGKPCPVFKDVSLPTLFLFLHLWIISWVVPFPDADWSFNELQPKRNLYVSPQKSITTLDNRSPKLLTGFVNRLVHKDEIIGGQTAKISLNILFASQILSDVDCVVHHTWRWST